MQEDITYKGLTASTSPYLCQNGEIELCTNIAPSGGYLKPMTPPQTVFQCEDGLTVVYIHKTAAHINYILSSDRTGTLYYKTRPAEKPQTIRQFGERTIKVCAIGNTLCVLTDASIHYILWKNNTYNYLGTKPPLLQFQFGLSFNYTEAYDRSTIETTDPDKTYSTAWRQTTYKATDMLTANADKQSVTFKPEKLTELQDHIWALINQTNALITKQGRFYAPFLVRCAYRLYDGTHIMHSAPVFLPVSMPTAYCVRVANVFHNNNNGEHLIEIADTVTVSEETAGSTKDFKISHLAFAYQPADVALTCGCINHYLVEELKQNWADIVKAVDIFVTPPIISEDPSEQVRTASLEPTSAVCLQSSSLADKSTTWWLKSNHNYGMHIACDIPRLSDKAYLDKIHAHTAFYKVHSYNLETDDIPRTPFVEVPIDKSALVNLATSQLLTDDYNTHNTKLPFFDADGRCLTTIQTYNARINISCIRERLFKGFAPNALLPYCEYKSYTLSGADMEITIHNAYVFLRTDQGIKVVSANGPEGTFNNQRTTKAIIANCPIFYPDTRAYRMLLMIDSENYIDLPMQPHTMLNGAVTRGAVFRDAGQLQQTDLQQPEADDTLDITNKIYTSQVNNPFFFPLTNINTVSEGRIVGLSSAAKALSQGQFGQFPLYAFTTEGVWAMQVSDTGAFVTRQPVTRDVCTNPDSITPIDNAVAFATQRGIMLISGSESRCITEPLNTDTPYQPETELPQVGYLIDQACTDRQPPHFKPFTEFLNGCGIIYNYNKQQIILFNPLSTYAYVYSITDRQWGIMLSNITHTVNAYPEAMAMNLKGELVTYSNPPVTGQPVSVFVLTRPIKLGHPDQLKTVRVLLQRGSISQASFKQVLYASNDLHNWKTVTTSANLSLRAFTGNPYKYFRLAFTMTIPAEESLTGFSVEYFPKLTHKMR